MVCFSLGRLVALMSRLFAFGCSFTNYRWRTWADILGEQYDHFENWGQSGAGNHYIFNAVMECDQRRTWNADDTVIICWTNVMREDRYVENRGWITLGNVMTSPIFTKEFLTDSVSERGNVIRDLAYVKAVKSLLELSKVTWRFLSMCPFAQADPWDQRKMHQCADAYELYADVLDCFLPSFTEVLGHNFWQHDRPPRQTGPDGGRDYHPIPQEHLLYLDTVLPGWVTSEHARQTALTDPCFGTATGINRNPRL